MEIDDVSVIDDLTVKFTFKRKGRDLSFVAGGLPIFSPKWGLPDSELKPSTADKAAKAGTAETADKSEKGDKAEKGERVAFDKLRFEKPIASGPYVIDHADSGNNITYKRNPNYWPVTCQCARVPTTSTA